MPNHYLVDGYNVLHCTAAYKPMMRMGLETARDAFINQLALFCANSQDSVTVVFDGSESLESNVTPFAGVPRLEVRYSPGKHSADTVIERLIYNAPERTRAVVVTRDRGLRELCQGMGAFSMAPESFLTTVREWESRTAQHVQTYHARKNIAAVEERLEPGQLKQLEEFKKRLGS